MSDVRSRVEQILQRRNYRLPAVGLHRIQLSCEIDNEFDIETDDITEFTDITDVDGLVALVERKLQARQ